MTFDLEMLDVLAWVTLILGLSRPLKKELKTHHPKILVYVTRQVLPVYIHLASQVFVLKLYVLYIKLLNDV